MKQRQDKSSLLLSSPIERDNVRVYDDCQRAASEACPGDAQAMENNGPSQKPPGLGQDGRMSSLSDIVAIDRGQGVTKNQNALKDSLSTLTCDTTSQACSGPEDNSAEAHETLTETSTLTFMDARTIDDSGEMHSLLGVDVHVKEFVLIDDDDDGDMSLREKTVTDVSVMDGNAADLVCGRLRSTSSGSFFVGKDETPLPQPPHTSETETPAKTKRCCLCTIL